MYPFLQVFDENDRRCAEKKVCLEEIKPSYFLKNNPHQKMYQNIHGLKEIVNRYHGFILDIWGVLHNGVHAFPKSLATLENLYSRNKSVALLSNSPRQEEPVIEQLEHLGIHKKFYHTILTSGGVARTLIQQWVAEEGYHCFFMGTPAQKQVLKGFDLTFVDSIHEADFIYNSGPEDISTNLSHYQFILKEAHIKKLKMFCSNPDLEARLGEEKILCAGTLAHFYKTIGGPVFFTGKPHQHAYKMLFEKAHMDPKTTLCVGDSMAHDMLGGYKAGCDTLLVRTGIDAHIQHDTLKTNQKYPTYVIDAFQWNPEDL